MKTYDSLWLQDYRTDVYSQSGEDGVIGKILERLPTVNRWCVEFGAWNGRHLSNTRHLIERCGYSAVLIEGNAERFQSLKNNNHDNNAVIVVNKFVGFTEQDGLDTLLNRDAIPKDFDFLSIDIDGNDYHAWAAINVFKPKIVCIEFNPTIPNDVIFTQEANHTINQGSSLSALVKLGKSKGYELICCLPANAFFVDTAYYLRFGISDNRPEVLRTDVSAVPYLFFGYDGTVFLRGRSKLPWHGLVLTESRLQVVPKIFLQYPETFGGFRRRLFWFYRKIHRLFNRN